MLRLPLSSLPLRRVRLLRAAAVALVLGLPLALLGAPAAADTAFLAGVEDLPLMPGLAEVEGAATVFDAPQGRIIEAFAAGAVSADEIRAFYGQTLPQLGWVAVDSTPSGPTEFRREGERLTLEITAAASTTTVRFTLAPQ
jgi:hypothetical protein